MAFWPVSTVKTGLCGLLQRPNSKKIFRDDHQFFETLSNRFFPRACSVKANNFTGCNLLYGKLRFLQLTSNNCMFIHKHNGQPVSVQPFLSQYVQFAKKLH